MSPGLLVKMFSAAMLLAVAFAIPRGGIRWFHAAEGALGAVARRRQLSVVLVGLLSFVGSAAVGLLAHTPAPTVHDEFSYLLAGDTFAVGRLSNPTHPMWVHFESMQIIQHPTYASKFPPGQGLALATGQVLSGHAIVGVWLSMALACAALTWMLQGWVPARWALVGGLLAAVRLGMFSYWAQSYWGGAVAVLGGALVFGALRRIVRRPQVGAALLLGLGLAILANSRPYEGLLASLPAGAMILAWMGRKKSPTGRLAIIRAVLPIVGLLTLTAGAMGYYNWRVTGDPLRLPYFVYEETYSIHQVFRWQRPRSELMYRHQAMRDFHVDMASRISKRQGFRELIMVGAKRLMASGGFYLGLPLTVPLLMLPWTLRKRWMRFALLTCGVLAAGLVVETKIYPHYSAPITSLVFVLVVESMRYLHVWRWRGRPTGRFIVWAIVILSVVYAPQLRPKPHAWSVTRARIEKSLEEDGNRHLVLVRYRPQHNPHYEWVYNAADIDRARVVWARVMGPAQNRKLFEYFRDRLVWVVEADAEPPRVVRILVGSEPNGPP